MFSQGEIPIVEQNQSAISVFFLGNVRDGTGDEQHRGHIVERDLLALGDSRRGGAGGAETPTCSGHTHSDAMWTVAAPSKYSWPTHDVSWADLQRKLAPPG